MAVEHGPENLDVAGLLLRKKVSRASKIEIALADGKARAWPAELLQHGKPLFGLLRIRFRSADRRRRAIPPRPTRPLS